MNVQPSGERFRLLGLSDASVKAVLRKGFELPTPIQEQVIPALLLGDRDLIGRAQTGTGKTAAFGLPILEKIDEHPGYVQALILTPTRELALQVAEELNSLKGSRRVTITPIYGGVSLDEQVRRLDKGVDIVVGTPGRVIDHLSRGILLLDRLKWFILDEADEMLDMGFIDDVEWILRRCGQERRTLFFSATIPDVIRDLAGDFMRDPLYLSVVDDLSTPEQTVQLYVEVEEGDKLAALSRIIDTTNGFYGLIFARTKLAAEEIAQKLIERGYEADSLHGDLSQAQREKILNRFRSRRTPILVATDVAARGLDIADLTHVINLSPPQDPESYIHRIGRTGRAGKEGTAITFVTPEEVRRLRLIRDLTGTPIEKHTLPGAETVIRWNREKIRSLLEERLENLEGEDDPYSSLAEELLKDLSPRRLVAELIRFAFPRDLDKALYPEIKEPCRESDEGIDRVKIFFARGSMDDFTPETLNEYLARKTEIDGARIKILTVMEKFSFFTVPENEAEKVLSCFAAKGRRKRPVAERAKGQGDASPPSEASSTEPSDQVIGAEEEPPSPPDKEP